MIGSHDEFESVLEEATRLLDVSPADGTPEHDRLLSHMREIAAYRPRINMPASSEPSPSARLSRKLDDFEARLRPRFSGHWQGMVGGDLTPPGAAPK